MEKPVTDAGGWQPDHAVRLGPVVLCVGMPSFVRPIIATITPAPDPTAAHAQGRAGPSMLRVQLTLN